MFYQARRANRNWLRHEQSVLFRISMLPVNGLHDDVALYNLVCEAIGSMGTTHYAEAYTIKRFNSQSIHYQSGQMPRCHARMLRYDTPMYTFCEFGSLCGNQVHLSLCILLTEVKMVVMNQTAANIIENQEKCGPMAKTLLHGNITCGTIPNFHFFHNSLMLCHIGGSGHDRLPIEACQKHFIWSKLWIIVKSFNRFFLLFFFEISVIFDGPQLNSVNSVSKTWPNSWVATCPDIKLFPRFLWCKLFCCCCK